MTLGGFNLGVGTVQRRIRTSLTRGPLPATIPISRCGYATKDGLPPVQESLYDDREVPSRPYPFADLLLQTFKEGSDAAGEPGLQRHLVRGAGHAPPAVFASIPKSDVNVA